MTISMFKVIPPTTLAKTSFPFDSNQYDSITVSADALAGSETVTLQVVAGVTNKQVTDIYGTVINLTASVPAVALEGGPQYVFVKSVTAASCGVYISPKIK